ncbi:MAG: hypothetical protein RBT05_12120 [Bacteroidales bacterium]|jgi:hypothetical protein|nr:hypothetical protein [Bacteroidales bacterium]
MSGLNLRMENIQLFQFTLNKELPKGLLRKIIREDLEIELEEFIGLYNSKK